MGTNKTTEFLRGTKKNGTHTHQNHDRSTKKLQRPERSRLTAGRRRCRRCVTHENQTRAVEPLKPRPVSAARSNWRRRTRRFRRLPKFPPYLWCWFSVEGFLFRLFFISVSFLPSFLSLFLLQSTGWLAFLSIQYSFRLAFLTPTNKACAFGTAKLYLFSLARARTSSDATNCNSDHHRHKRVRDLPLFSSRSRHSAVFYAGQTPDTHTQPITIAAGVLSFCVCVCVWKGQTSVAPSILGLLASSKQTKCVSVAFRGLNSLFATFFCCWTVWNLFDPISFTFFWILIAMMKLLWYLKKYMLAPEQKTMLTCFYVVGHCMECGPLSLVNCFVCEKNRETSWWVKMSMMIWIRKLPANSTADWSGGKIWSVPHNFDVEWMHLSPNNHWKEWSRSTCSFKSVWLNLSILCKRRVVFICLHHCF